jgi:UDP-N-acetylmuramoyl-L-alanyl-D-glutamate--2,6-diaminopimelate ligase
MLLNHLLPTLEMNDVEIKNLQNDSRQVKPGDLFLAYPGHHVDGRLFIEEAIRRGAVAIVYEPGIPMPTMQIPMYSVPDLAKNLPLLAKRFYAYPEKALTFTGVTGTNGKTSVAYQLTEAHQLFHVPAAYIGTLGEGDIHNLQPLGITTPDALNLARLSAQYYQKGIQKVSMEVSSHALEQGRVAGIDFNQAIFTNLSHDHLDYHLSMEAYARSKAKLFESSALKWAIVNHDDHYQLMITQNLPVMCQKLTFGMNEGSDVRALNVEVNMNGCQFDVTSPWGSHHLQITSMGIFNVYNALAIFSSLMVQGYPEEEVVRVLTLLHASPGRMEVVRNDPCVIVDYAHTPDALENVMSTLSQLKQRRLWVVFGCGGDRDKIKRPLMGRIASQYADEIIITNDNPRNEVPEMIIDEISRGLLPHVKVNKIPDRKEAIYHALQFADKEDIVLVAGKGHEAYQQIGKQRLKFSDQAVVKGWHL